MTVRKGKSTHQGHCQACGRLQMLPNGTLSLHGYKVTHGYFSGICRGAKELPFEQSCALVQLFIDHATSQLAQLERLQADLPYSDSLEQVCTKANSTYADWLEHEADSLRRYIKWQTKRVTEWVEQPLKPLAGPLKDDKMGFKPTEARY